MSSNLVRQVERLREGLLRLDDGLAPEFAQELTQEELNVALSYIQHGGDTLEVATSLQLSVADVLGLVSRREFRAAVLMFIGTLGGTYEEMLSSLKLDFFAKLHESLHSTKDRTRIEALRLISGMFEGQLKRQARAEERASLDQDDLRDFDKAANTTANMSNSELTQRLARMGQTLH